MNLRTWINSNQRLSLLIVVIIIALVVTIVARGLRAPDQTQQEVYFWDLGTGELFTAKRTEQPPIGAPSGAEGVRAFVFACGDCKDQERRFVAWLMNYTQHATALAKAPKPDDPLQMGTVLTQINTGKLISAAPTGSAPPQWVPFSSPEGASIQQAALGKCGPNSSPRAMRECMP